MTTSKCDRCTKAAIHYDYKADESLCWDHWQQVIKEREQAERRG